jgi:hypothetical protein
MLPDNVAMAARQYLTRFWELAPRVRDAMGKRLTGEVMRYVSPPPPPGFRPEIYLSAVLAERRHREEIRLAERAARRDAISRRGLPLGPPAVMPTGQVPVPPPVVMTAGTGGPPPPPPPYGAGPGPVPEWLGGTPGTPPTFLPPRP